MTDEPQDAIWSESIIEIDDDFLSPAPLALTAFVLAVASVCGFGLMNGSAYVLPFYADLSSDNGGRLVIGTLLGVALAMIPAWLGWRASSRLLDDDPQWVDMLARAAVILGLGSGALRLVVAFIEAATDGPAGFARL